MSVFRRKPKPLRYVLSWCDCGAQMACDDPNRQAVCSDVLLGLAAGPEHVAMPYAFWRLRTDQSGKAPVRSAPRAGNPQ